MKQTPQRLLAFALAWALLGLAPSPSLHPESTHAASTSVHAPLQLAWDRVGQATTGIST